MPATPADCSKLMTTFKVKTNKIEYPLKAHALHVVENEFNAYLA
jgi:hypothetical protein